MSARRIIRIPLDRVFYRIGDVAALVGVKTHVLRFWESEFSGIVPQKSKSGQRVYRRIDVEHVLLIKHLLYTERFSIEGARRRIRELKRSSSLHETLKLALLPLPGWISVSNGVRFTSTLNSSERVADSVDVAASLTSAPAPQKAAQYLRPFAQETEGVSHSDLLLHARRLLELSERPIAEFFSY